ncbi:hypothetical protein ABH935_005406 [Catenulispora sp. GAS73]|uniref:hypothetical protein n=1 Tax=Catenulispora sp. GAS73 TaxID=3156269 RepID=UPI003514011D
MSKKKQCRKQKPSPPPNTSTGGQQAVPRHEQQLAVIGNTVLDIEAAFRLLRARPRDTVHIDVDAWARLYGMNGDPHAPIQLGPLFNRHHAAGADLRRPLILITLTLDNGDEVQLIADGSHRLYRGYIEGRDSLPAWILTAAETRAITLTHPFQNGATP